MMTKNLPKQVQALIDHYCKGKLSPFARKIGVSQSTLQRQMAAEDEKNLQKLLPKILYHCPEVRESWLYTGEGDMLEHPRTNPTCPAENAGGRLTGDALFEALTLAQLDQADVAKAAGLDARQWKAVQGNGEYPDFPMLQALYEQFGLNVEYLFSENSRVPWLPLSQVQVVEFLLGRVSEYPPHPDELRQWFGCTPEEAADFDADYRKWLELVRKRGYVRAKNEGKEPRLRRTWVEHFCQRAELEWIPDMRPLERGIVHLRDSSPKAERQQLEAERQELEAERQHLEAERQRLEAELSTERARLEAELSAERARLNEAQATIIRLQNELLALREARPQDDAERMAPPGDTERTTPAALPASAPCAQQEKR